MGRVQVGMCLGALIIPPGKNSGRSDGTAVCYSHSRRRFSCGKMDCQNKRMVIRHLGAVPLSTYSSLKPMGCHIHSLSDLKLVAD